MPSLHSSDDYDVLMVPNDERTLCFDCDKRPGTHSHFYWEYNPHAKRWVRVEYLRCGICIAEENWELYQGRLTYVPGQGWAI